VAWDMGDEKRQMTIRDETNDVELCIEDGYFSGREALSRWHCPRIEGLPLRLRTFLI
jgi:hypothetical protein